MIGYLVARYIDTLNKQHIPNVNSIFLSYTSLNCEAMRFKSVRWQVSWRIFITYPEHPSSCRLDCMCFPIYKQEYRRMRKWITFTQIYVDYNGVFLQERIKADDV